jgi:hypothetical protein
MSRLIRILLAAVVLSVLVYFATTLPAPPSAIAQAGLETEHTNGSTVTAAQTYIITPVTEDAVEKDIQIQTVGNDVTVSLWRYTGSAWQKLIPMTGVTATDSTMYVFSGIPYKTKERAHLIYIVPSGATKLAVTWW